MSDFDHIFSYTHGFSRFSAIVSKFLRTLSYSHKFTRILSYLLGIYPDSLRLSRIIQDFFRIRRYSLQFSHILIESLQFAWNLVRIPLDYFRFFRSLTYSLGICLDSLIFPRFIPDSSRFFFLVGFSHILSNSFVLFAYCFEFSRMLKYDNSDSLRLFWIILDSFKFIHILSNSLGLF